MVFRWRIFVPAGLVALAAASATGAQGRDSVLAAARRFNAGRAVVPIWSGAGVGGRFRDLLDYLEAAQAQGLDSADYGIPRLTSLAARRGDPDSLALLDLLATAALLRYATDLMVGRVAAAEVDTMWTASSRSDGLFDRLATGVDADRVGATLDDLAPPQEPAVRLRAALARYRAIAAQGGWPVLGPGPLLRLGSAGGGVALLRRRLEITDALVAGGGGPVFDEAVAAAVRRVQARHGLVADGVVGAATRAALDVTVQERIHQLELNLERWRWMPRDLGRRHLMVNTAAFTFALVDSARVAFVGRVVSGRLDWPTPIVATRLTEVTFSPRWNIPRSIAILEVLPAARRDPDYFRREGIHMMSDTTDRSVEVDPDTIGWDRLPDSAFAYRLWQEPGPRNPLGHVRFTIPNRYGVALHDTREPELFGALARAFSHGCVRLGDALRLAIDVLHDAPGWSPDVVRAAALLPDEWRVAVPDPFPTYLSYWTAWVEPDGAVEFRSDLYGWDAELAAALARRERVLP